MKQLYYIKLTNKQENLVGYKIGVTTKHLSRRFASYYGNTNIKLEVLYCEKRKDAERVELAILEKYSWFLMGKTAKKLLNKEHSAGFSEVFSTDIRAENSNFLYEDYLDFKSPVQKSIQALNYYTAKLSLGESKGSW